MSQKVGHRITGNLIPLEIIEQRIFLFRSHKVMLSGHLVELYGVVAKVLLQAVRRNIDRFPKDFMFQLTWQETHRLRSQTVTLKRGEHFKYRPYPFTEQDVAMLSGILSSERAIRVNVAIMRTFVKIRQILSTNKESTHKLNELERKIERHDEEMQNIFEAIRRLMTEPEKPKRRIGFLTV